MQSVCKLKELKLDWFLKLRQCYLLDRNLHTVISVLWYDFHFVIDFAIEFIPIYGISVYTLDVCTNCRKPFIIS